LSVVRRMAARASVRQCVRASTILLTVFFSETAHWILT